MRLDGVGEANSAHEGQKDVDDHHLAVWNEIVGKCVGKYEKGTESGDET